jgi:hypothetical protein
MITNRDNGRNELKDFYLNLTNQKENRNNVVIVIIKKRDELWKIVLNNNIK